MNLRDRLDRLTGYGMLDSGRAAPEVKPGEGDPPEGFRPASTAAGSTWRRRVQLPPDHPHGDARLGDLLRRDPADLPLLFPDEEPPGDWEELVFCDIETTGLSTGTGTYVFLVGLCFFRRGEVVLEQFFMPDPAEEPPLLRAVSDRLEQFPHVATFNGKRFDLPLLGHRYLLHRLPGLPRFAGHHDLLYPARALWGNILPSCALASLEEHRLGVRREDDVPGAEVPERYFLYLADGDPAHLDPVVEHNALDLFSCLTLLDGLLRRADDPEACRHPAENLALARRAERAGDDDRARRQLEHALRRAEGEDEFARAARAASLWYKRKKRWDEACRIWRRMVKKCENSRWGELAEPFAHVELAKYLEHRARRPGRALHYTEQAIGLVRRQVQLGLRSAGALEPLLHRRRRLRRRLRTRAESGHPDT